MDTVRDKKSWLKIGFLLLVIGLLLLGGIYIRGAQAAYNGGTKDKLCLGCHQMKSQVKTWQLSAHSEIACNSCHQGISPSEMYFRAKSGNYEKPIRAVTFIPDKICLGCHTTDRAITPPEGLIIPHSLHSKKGVDCIDCHHDLAHGTMADFGNRVAMKTCMRCHNGQKAPNTCNACHENKTVPANHSSITWGTSHGADALKNLQSCNSCHEYDLAKQAKINMVNGDYSIVQLYARSNSFCRDCHQKRPLTHDRFFSVTHRSQASKDKSGCFVCHNQSPQTSGISPTTTVYCSKCHVNGHPPDWLKTHKKSATLKDAQTCFSCHDTSSCTKCHKARKITG